MGIATFTRGSRNLEGVELVHGNEVHPYHLLRYDRAIFSQPAIEALQAFAEELSGEAAAQSGRQGRRQGKGKEGLGISPAARTP